MKKKHLKGMAWWRAYHGMVTHPRWGMTAIRCKRPVAEVLAVAVWLMESASRHAERGDVSHFDPEQCAFSMGMSLEHVEAIVAAFSKGKKPWIVDGRIESWEERQPKREDETAAARKAAFLERQNASERTGTQQNETEREVTPEQSRAEQSKEEQSRAEESLVEVAPSAPVPFKVKLTEKGGITAAPPPVPAKPRERKKREKLNVSGGDQAPSDPDKPASDALKGSQSQQNDVSEPKIPEIGRSVQDHNAKAEDDAAAAWLRDHGVRFLQSKGATLTAAGAIAGWAKDLNYRHTILRGIFNDAITKRVDKPIAYIKTAVERAAGKTPLDLTTIQGTADQFSA